MRNHPNAVMLFAAGFGTRMGALTATQPKPMIKVAGRSLIDHTLDLARAIAPNTMVANLHYLPDQLQRHLAPRGVHTLVESPDILETGGGLRNALPLLGTGPVFTTNTDAIWRGPNPFTLLKSHWNPETMDALLMCVPLENAIGHAGQGDFLINTSGQITRGPGVVYGGVQIIKTDLLDSISERVFSLNIIWDQMISKSRAYGLRYPGKWCDVGHPEGITRAETLLEAPDV